MSYADTQTQPIIAILLWLVALVFAVVAVFAGELALLVAAAAMAFGAFIAYALSSLQTTIGPEAIEVAFRFGRPRRTIALGAVVRAEVVRSKWWYGWGIRWIPGGTLWNVWGLDGVHLDLAGARDFRIGTDDPEGLRAAIAATRGDAGVDGCWGL